MSGLDSKERYRHAIVTLGGGRLNENEWKRTLDEAVSIHDSRPRYSATFDAVRPGESLKLPMKYVDGYSVAVPYRTIINIEATLAESAMMVEEMLRMCEAISDAVTREQSVKRVQEFKEAVKLRTHLRLVP